MKRSLLGRSAALVAFVIAAAFLAAATASAAPAPNPRAGYTVATPAGHAKAAVRFTVPSLNCASAAPFQGVGAVARLQDASGATVGGVVLICDNGVAFYDAAIEINGQTTALPNEPVSPGDVIAARVSETATATTVDLSNRTKGWSQSMSGGGGSVTEAFVGMDVVNCIGSLCSAVPQFSSTSFNGARIDGKPIGDQHHTRSEIVSAAGQVEVIAGPLNRPGTAFTATWKASCQPTNQDRC